VIVLPIAVALTIAPALSPVASWFRRRRHLERPAVVLALLTGLAMVTGLIAIATISVVEQFDELRAAVSRAVDDIARQLEGEPFRLSAARADELESSLADAWREASAAAAGVQTVRNRRGRRSGRCDALLRPADGAALWAHPAALPPMCGPRSIAPAGGRGMSSADSSAAPPRSRRSTQS
jgi:hypothetical protein